MKMKQFLSLLLVLITIGAVQAQGKIGHINSNELLMAMPDRDAAEKKLEEFAKQLEGQLTSMSMEYEKKLTDFFFYTLAYSFSRSQYRDIRPGFTDAWYPADYDFGHAFTFTGGFKKELHKKEWYKNLSKKLWFRLLSPIMPIAGRMEFSTKFRFLGGRPRTIPLYDTTVSQWSHASASELNTSRYQPYHRLDMRYERRYGFGLLHLIYYIELQNLYNRDNIWMYVYSDTQAKETPIYQFPFFPVGGVIIGF